MGPTNTEYSGKEGLAYSSMTGFRGYLQEEAEAVTREDFLGLHTCT